MEAFDDKIHMDGLNLSYRKCIFDKVLCVAVLHHLPTKMMRLRMLMEMKKVLKAGGFIYLTVFNYESKKMIY